MNYCNNDIFLYGWTSFLFFEQIIDSKTNFEQSNVPPTDVANASKHVV